MSRTSTSIFRGGLFNGRTSKSIAGNSAVSLSAAEAANRIIKLTGALTGNVPVTFPVTSDDEGLIWKVRNETTGAFRVTVLNPSGTPLDIPQGTTVEVEFNGTQFVLADTASRPSRLDRKYSFCAFRQQPICARNTGAAASGTAGHVNVMLLPGASFEYHIIGTQTLVAPAVTDEGLNIALDQTSGEGLEITQGITARSPSAFVIGTDPAFFVRAKIKVEDASGAGNLVLGFRKAAAYNADEEAYTDIACIGIVGTSNPNTIQTQTIDDDGSTTTTNTTNTWADNATKDLKVLVSSAGAVTYQIDGAAPTTVVEHTIDSGDTVIPFLYFTHAADVAGEVELIEWECGYQSDAA